MSPVLYRPHRGGLDESMREVVEVNDLPQLVRHMRREVESWYPKDELPTEENTKLEPYAYDPRIKWDTYLVTVKGQAWGYTNGPLADNVRPPIVPKVGQHGEDEHDQ